MSKASTVDAGPVLKTGKRPVNFGDVVLKALFERMDPETRTVAPQWRTLASSLGVCTMTLGRYINQLKEDGRIETVPDDDGKRRTAERAPDCLAGPTGSSGSRTRYFIDERIDAEWAASVEPRFKCEHVSRAPRHRPVQKSAEMFTCLSLENFKSGGGREIRFDRVSMVHGKSGADGTQVFDAMRLLHGVARGGDASGFPALWFGTDWPTTLSISLDTPRHGRLAYSVTLQRIDGSRVRVADERLASGSETLLVRRRHFYTHLATKGRIGIGTTSFALHDAGKFLDADDPVVQFKRRLGELWLLNPDPNAMKSEIGFGVVNAGTGGFSDFVTCMVVQQTQEAVAAAMRHAVLRLRPDLVGYTVEKNAKGVPYLAVRHRDDLDPDGTPFALMDNAAKMLFVVAFVCAMNGRPAPAPVVWLSPFNWLGERERSAADRLVRAAFARRGQMIMLV